MATINSDEFATVTTANGGEPLKEYDVEINGIPTTVKLTDADAKRRGLLDDGEKPTKSAKAPANKSRTPANKGESEG